MAWKTVGPQRLTDAYRRYQYSGLTILPSHFFIPEHFSGARYEGSGPVYAQQHWGSTRRSYDTLHLQAVGGAAGAQPSPAPTTAPTPTPAPVAPPPAAMPAPTPPAPAADTPAAPRRSALEDQHAPYFVQKVTVSRELVGRNRVEVFRDICKGRRVLHVGCADWPISDPATSLHVQLDAACAQLDGFDIHTDAFPLLQPHVRGRFFSDWSQVTDAYDIVLVPEVLEHVPNVEQFLQQLDAVQAAHVILTVPDAFQCMKRHFDYVGESETFVEVVHPDHNCWYTPYTLTSTLKKYTPWQVDGLWFFNNISLLAITSRA
jgi:mannosyltransferase OCH1-like enzyme